LNGLIDHLETCEDSKVLCKVCLTTVAYNQIEQHSLMEGCFKTIVSRAYQIPKDADVEVITKDNMTDSEVEKLLEIVKKGWNFGEIKSETNLLNDEVEKIWQNASVMVRLQKELAHISFYSQKFLGLQYRNIELSIFK